MEVKRGSHFPGVSTMKIEDLDAELADALDQVDAAQTDVDTKREELATARQTLYSQRARVTEIQGEIRSRVRKGQSTRPMFEGIGMVEAKATFNDPDTPATKKRPRKAAEVAGATP
jgi:chromosome segregation ATPase